MKDLLADTLKTHCTRQYCASVILHVGISVQSHTFLKCVACHLCPAGAEHGPEALKAPTRLRQPVSTREDQEGLELHAHIGAEESDAPRLRSRQLCCSVANVFIVRSCTWVRVSCGCDCLRVAYQVPSQSSSRQPRCPLPAVATRCVLQYSARLPECNVWKMFCYGLWQSHAMLWGKMVFRGGMHGHQPCQYLFQVVDLGFQHRVEALQLFLSFPESTRNLSPIIFVASDNLPTLPSMLAQV